MFKRTLLAAALACAFPLPALAASDAELAALRAEFAQKLKEVQSTYEARLKALESQQTQIKSDVTAPPPARADKLGQVGSGSSFNPQISVIFDGVYYNDNKQGGGIEAMEHIDGITHGHDHAGHEHAELGRGFNLRETEIAFSATVSPYFDANLLLTVDSGGGVVVEEAYFDTRALPGGVKIRGGKFLSGIGYLNSQHPHTWDFVDQNLAYATLLGQHGLMDTGLQFTWLPKTGNLYTLLGMELLQGNEHNFVSSGKELPEDIVASGLGFGELAADKAGPRLLTAYAKFGPDLGDTHALQIGASYAVGRQLQEVHDHRPEAGAVVHGLQGEGWLWGTDVVYKFDAPGAYGQGDFTLAAEYLHQRKDLSVAFHETNAAAVGDQRKFSQDGFYLQGVYGFAPNWQLAARYDVTGMTNELDRGSSVTEWGKSDRWTLSLTRHLTEFSRLRLQASTADLSVEGNPERVNQFFLQYQHSLGAHGAHKF
jgi:hypothetical protein